VPEHTELLPRWIDALAPGGRLAFQVPGNFDAPSHVLLRELCDEPRWRDRLAGAVRRDPVLDPAGYLDLLARHGCAVDAWETTYTQVLAGDDPVLRWMEGTALRPVLTALGPDAPAFLDVLAERLRAAYPAAPYGTVFPFRRVFVVTGRAGP
jgi:trans-aconitate 2-methyltransferase